ncbi:hypothetical protein Mapa_014909 [Marchantia paleacea]|nr:hypothetical protein Mapa_014909 [Marchantia paleacea]
MDRERERDKMNAHMQELRQSGLSLSMYPGPSDNRKKEDNRFSDGGMFSLRSPLIKNRSGDGKLVQFGETGDMTLSEKPLRMGSEVPSGVEERRSTANSNLHLDSRVEAVHSLTPMGLLSDSTSSPHQPSSAQTPPLCRQGIPPQRGSPPSGGIIAGAHVNEGQKTFANEPHSLHLAMDPSKRSMTVHGPPVDHQQIPKAGQRRRTPNTREAKVMVSAGNAQQQVFHQHALQQLHQQHGIQHVLYHHPSQHSQESFYLQGQYNGAAQNAQLQTMQQFSSTSQHLAMPQPQGLFMSNHSLKVEPVELERSASVDRVQLEKVSSIERSSPPDSLSPKESVSVAETRGVGDVDLKKMNTDESKPSASLGSAAESKDSVRSGIRRDGGDRESLHPQSQSSGRTSRENMFADLNAEPPASDGEDECLLRIDEATTIAQPESSRTTTEEKRKRKKTIKDPKILKEGEEVDNKKAIKAVKSRAKPKVEVVMDGIEGDGDNHLVGVLTTKDDKLKSLKDGLVYVTRKQPKNANAHFTLGLLYQRSGQFAKAGLSYTQAIEALKQSEVDSNAPRPQLMATIQVHHAQCLLEELFGVEGEPEKGLTDEALEKLVLKLKEATLMDIGQAAVWSTLGLLLLRAGKNKSAIQILTSLLEVVPDHLDALNNLGVAYLHSGELARAARCFQTVLEKDKTRPGAYSNYAVQLLRQYGSYFASAGAGAGPEAYLTRQAAAKAAQQCSEAALKEDAKAGHVWSNLAAAHTALGNIESASQCLEQAARLDPTRMSTRYAVAAHRIRDAERCDNSSDQLGYAANEMASILREGDSTTAQPSLGWSGLAMVNRAQHESAAAFEEGGVNLKEAEDRALHTLEQAIDEDPQDAVQWHQMGLHTLCTLQFGAAQKFLKTSIVRRRSCSPAWTNLGIALQLSEDPSIAEGVYKEALVHAPQEQAHSIHANLGNLYRQQKRFSEAHECFKNALELCPDYAPACNNLGLLYVAENKWQEAVSSFDRALRADPYLDAAKSNRMKAIALAQMQGNTIEESGLPSNPVSEPAPTSLLVDSASTAVASLCVHSPPQQIQRDPFPLPSVS